MMLFDADQVYDLCDPDKRECFCLYGLSDKTWEVTAPEELVPTELPEPVLGINFGKEGMDRTKWLYLVAIHSDSWLLAVAFYNGFSLDCDQRKHLFNLMNDLPTVAEVVADHWKLDDEDKSTEDSRTNTREITDVSVQKFAGFAFQRFHLVELVHIESRIKNNDGSQQSMS
uniref:PHD finger protein ALFIN-LIKE n=1 Tax=Cajanus cajan TaxID=3821 RepID=A0A151QTE8_CAJCA|nr:PHD finger protein At5g26210 family [Cajanus cajan]